jgi:DNA polymerase-3 subunit delta
VFWKDERELGAQLRHWRGKRLERLVDKLVGLHRSLLANSQDADLLLSQGLAEIARAAAA